MGQSSTAIRETEHGALDLVITAFEESREVRVGRLAAPGVLHVQHPGRPARFWVFVKDAASASRRLCNPACVYHRPRTITPSSRATLRTSSSGFAETSSRSARLPGLMVPKSSALFRNSAASTVAVRNESYGVSP